jgi:hypothetical protein
LICVSYLIIFLENEGRKVARRFGNFKIRGVVSYNSQNVSCLSAYDQPKKNLGLSVKLPNRRATGWYKHKPDILVSMIERVMIMHYITRSYISSSHAYIRLGLNIIIIIKPENLNLVKNSITEEYQLISIKNTKCKYTSEDLFSGSWLDQPKILHVGL